MEINYCDLCGSVIKGINFYSLYIAKPHEKTLETNEDYLEYYNEVKKELKEICPSCYHVFNKIFELRLQKLSELSEELNNIYNLKSKKIQRNEIMKRNKTKLVSNCCNAPIKVGGIGDFEKDKKVCTMYHVCTKCNQPCDTHINERKTWIINPATKIKSDKRKKFQDKLTKKEIENYRKNEDF